MSCSEGRPGNMTPHRTPGGEGETRTHRPRAGRCWAVRVTLVNSYVYLNGRLLTRAQGHRGSAQAAHTRKARHLGMLKSISNLAAPCNTSPSHFSSSTKGRPRTEQQGAYSATLCSDHDFSRATEMIRRVLKCVLLLIGVDMLSTFLWDHKITFKNPW